MKIETKQAAKLFFKNSSLLTVYYEAIANSIDAGASHINIEIRIDSFSEQDTLEILIIDNGNGFIEKNFQKFNKVLKVEDEQHKGIGRLVFLNYFEKVEIESFYDNKVRKFEFNEEYDGEYILNDTKESENKTILKFKHYKKDTIKSYDYLIPLKIKNLLLEHFFPRFYQMKVEKHRLEIQIHLETKEKNDKYDFYTSNCVLNVSELPELKEKIAKDEDTLYDQFKLLYSINKNIQNQSVISAVCADGRTVHMDIISNTEFPQGYELIFLLYSDYFHGKTDAHRENLIIENSQYKKIKKYFTKLVSEVLIEEISEIKEYNQLVTEKVEKQYPHLIGYFDKQFVGLIDRSSIISDAQEKFYNDQKEILETESLSDEQYERSLIFSSRVLTSYVLYRQKIINKLQQIEPSSHEGEIHNLIAPKKNKFFKNEKINDLFVNNAWVLDDKYMSYSKILSDYEIEVIYKEMDIQGQHYYSEKELGRPDITVIFSNDPEEKEKFDVVIIELKKIGVSLAEKEEVISQLKQRARRLIEFYPDKIQRIWFYGIVDFDKEFKASLKESGFISLFSFGEYFYKAQEVIYNYENMDKKMVDLFILSYDAILKDAESRNSTFLNILREGIVEFVNS